MNYDQARQRDDGRRWDYTRRRDKRIWPLGYCAGSNTATTLNRHNLYHSDGHETAEQAERCWWRYCLDRLGQARELQLDEQRKTIDLCELSECKEPATHIMGLGYVTNGSPFHETLLCQRHASVESMERLYPFEPGLMSIHS